MTTDELKQEAEEYTNTHDTLVMGCEENLDCTNLMTEAYIASAEPREKRIAELERKLKVETELSNRLGLAYREYEELTKEQDEHLAKLEKENAELRKDKKELCHSISEGGKACVYLNEQLTKAKEIIKKLYAVYYDPCVTESDLKYRDELFAEIKQFLSEVKK